MMDSRPTARATTPNGSMTSVEESAIGFPVSGSVAGTTLMKSVASRNANAPPAARSGARLGPGMWIPDGVGGVGIGRATFGPAVAYRRMTQSM